MTYRIALEPTQESSHYGRGARRPLTIEELTAVIERSRKLGLIAKIAITAGALWLLAAMLGAVSLDPIALMSAMAAVIGGIVVFGSHNSTCKQAAVRITAAQARGAELIDQINLRVVQ